MMRSNSNKVSQQLMNKVLFSFLYIILTREKSLYRVYHMVMIDVVCFDFPSSSFGVFAPDIADGVVAAEDIAEGVPAVVVPVAVAVAVIPCSAAVVAPIVIAKIIYINCFPLKLTSSRCSLR